MSYKSLVIVLLSLALFLSSCSNGGSEPQYALIGQWSYQGSSDSTGVFAADLEFTKDGQLMIDNSDEIEYVVIAPGRVKISLLGQPEVINYEIINDQLNLYIDKQVYSFQMAGFPEKPTDVDAFAQTDSIITGIFTAAPIEVMPTLLIIAQSTPEPSGTSTVILPTYTPTDAISTQAATQKYSVQPIQTKRNEKDGMTLVFVPIGEFIMGSDPETDPYFWGAEAPSHAVFVDDFWIYQTEVTNSMYQACVAEHACPKPLWIHSRTVKDYYENPAYANYPVVQVNYADAVSYCRWAGGRLPLEAEWEKAARGTDGRMFPWGNQDLQPAYANFGGTNCSGFEKECGRDGYYEIAPVGSFPEGVSPYGALDMAGNVWEWVFDYFDQSYYSYSPSDNPRGPLTGSRRVIKGGSWINPASGLRPAARTSLLPQEGLDTAGFRCVMDISD